MESREILEKKLYAVNSQIERLGKDVPELILRERSEVMAKLKKLEEED
jgi:uncharacterized protein (DUF169 family)